MRGPLALARAWVRRSRMKSPWLIHFDCGGCNGCDIEVLDTLTPRYSAERFGVINVGDPRQGDVLVVTGPANRRNAGVLRAVYDQMAEPKAVVAVGSCAAHGGIFRGSPNVLGGVGDGHPGRRLRGRLPAAAVEDPRRDHRGRAAPGGGPPRPRRGRRPGSAEPGRPATRRTTVASRHREPDTGPLPEAAP